MADHISGALAQAVGFIINIVNTFAQFDFPGTDVPVIVIMAAVWGVYFIWRYLLSRIFDIEAKE